MARLQPITLDWNQPLLPAVTERLLSFSQGPLIDLSHLLVIVPTRQSGRRLRESLAIAAQEKGLLPPELLTPESLLSRSLKAQPVANEACCIAAWVDVLSAIDLQHFDSLFPLAPERNTGWQLGMAQRIMELRDDLGEEDFDLQKAAQLASEQGFETERWRQLARLEGLYFDQINARSLIDPKAARRQAADQLELPSEIERICLIATPDPQSLTLRALDGLSERLPLEIWTYGPSEAFDPWGRPLTEYWNQRDLDLEGWSCRLKALAEPQSIAQEIAALTAPTQPEASLIGVADSDLSPIIADELTRRSIPHYDPAGHAIHLSSIGRLAELLCQLNQEANTATIRSLLQHPDLFRWLESSNSQNARLGQLDRCFEAHLCADLQSLLRFASEPGLKRSLKAIQKLQRELSSANTFANGLSTALQTIYATHEIGSDERNNTWREQAEAIRSLIGEVATAESSFPKLDKALPRHLILQKLHKTKVHPDRPAQAHDLLGWLELLWNDAPQLILAGINEGKVPESITGDAFLPETLRAALGLRTNAQRFARDAYLLEALCRRRAQNKGQTHILVPQTAADGSPLKPSRLLFLGTQETLLPRTRQLFPQSTEVHQPSDHSIAWKLSAPAELPMPEHISVSAIKNYLECPFRFFLRHIMKMRPVDVETREMSPAAFGSFIHAILSEIKGLEINAQTNATDLLKRLNAIAETQIEQQFGPTLSFALRLQKEAVLARIQSFVEHQIEEAKNAGSIEISDTELPFNLNLEGLNLRGIIDRIDRRGETVELIDYKTADSPKTPEKAHLAIVARKEPPAHLPEAAFFEHEGKRYRWIDLQLPLYLLSQNETARERPSVAYFNLAKTLEKSGVARWEGFTQSHLDSARHCAEAVIQQIKAGIFWPPNLDLREDYDDFAPYFPDGIENSVEAASFMQYTFGSATESATTSPEK